MCLDIGTPKNINFSFETNGKLIALNVPILNHFRVTVFLSLKSVAALMGVYKLSMYCGHH